MGELLVRFLLGGLIVSVLAIIGEVFKPQRFAGLFGAAPSVALATITLTVMKQGKAYAALESRAMIWGAVAFLAYAWCMCQVMVRIRPKSLWTAVGLIPIWFAVALDSGRCCFAES